MIRVVEGSRPFEAGEVRATGRLPCDGGGGKQPGLEKERGGEQWKVGEGWRGRQKGCEAKKRCRDPLSVLFAMARPEASLQGAASPCGKGPAGGNRGCRWQQLEAQPAASPRATASGGAARGAATPWVRRPGLGRAHAAAIPQSGDVASS